MLFSTNNQRHIHDDKYVMAHPSHVPHITPPILIILIGMGLMGIVCAPSPNQKVQMPSFKATRAFLSICLLTNIDLSNHLKFVK